MKAPPTCNVEFYYRQMNKMEDSLLYRGSGHGHLMYTTNRMHAKCSNSFGDNCSFNLYYNHSFGGTLQVLQGHFRNISTLDILDICKQMFYLLCSFKNVEPERFLHLSTTSLPLHSELSRYAQGSSDCKTQLYKEEEKNKHTEWEHMHTTHSQPLFHWYKHKEPKVYKWFCLLMLLKLSCHNLQRCLIFVMQSRGISRKLDMWHFQFSIWWACSLGEVHFAENPTWIGTVVPKL